MKNVVVLAALLVTFALIQSVYAPFGENPFPVPPFGSDDIDVSDLDHGELKGLGDDDHTQYVLHSSWNATNDTYFTNPADRNLDMNDYNVTEVDVIVFKDNNVRLHETSHVDGSHTICIGYNCNVSGGGVAIGWSSDSHNTQAIAIGQQADNYGNNALVLGVEGFSNASSSVCIGTYCETSGLSSEIAIGGFSETNAMQGMAMGWDAYVSGLASVAIGPEAQAIADDCVAIGKGSVCDTPDTVVIGQHEIITSSPLTLSPGDVPYIILNDTVEEVQLMKNTKVYGQTLEINHQVNFTDKGAWFETDAFGDSTWWV